MLIKKRDAYNSVFDFINSDRCYDGVVGVIYGLRGTGKTTIMEQIMANNSENLSFVFWEAEKKDTMEKVYSCLDEAVSQNVDCVFIDEITNVPDFMMIRAVADLYKRIVRNDCPIRRIGISCNNVIADNGVRQLSLFDYCTDDLERAYKLQTAIVK